MRLGKDAPSGRAPRILAAAIIGAVTAPVVGLTAEHYGLNLFAQALLVATALMTVIAGLLIVFPGRG